MILCLQVYDLSDYLPEHPGGDIILREAGHDATAAFSQVPAHKIVGGLIKQILLKYYIGDLATEPKPDSDSLTTLEEANNLH